MADGGSTKMDKPFEAPGKGPWEIDATHFPRPITRFMAETISDGFTIGFAEGTARYGVTLSHFKPAIVNGFYYHQPVAFGAPEGAAGPPPRPVFFLLTRLVPAMRARFRAAHEAFEKKLWRADLERWDSEVKPKSIAAHRAIQAVDPTTLDDAALGKHITTLREHVRRMIIQHHQFTATVCVPVGDLLAHTREWTGKPVHELLAMLKGSTPVSVGVAAKELDALAEAVHADAEAEKFAASDAAPDELLEKFETWPGAVGAATRAYLDVVGYRNTGYDVGDCYALELPHALGRAIRAAVSGSVRGHDEAAVKERIARVRDAVPDAHRARFDELLAEARLINRLRDERGVYSDGWATGLARRGILAAGERAVEKGVLDDAKLMADASHDEIQGLIRGEQAVTSAELRARAEWRATRSSADAPPWLGAKPAPPPPVEWLPENGRRMHRAMAVFIGALFDEGDGKSTATSVRGLPVSPGTYEGVARVVIGQDDFGRIEQGDVLVTRATSPYFNVVLPMLGAIVTDRGGQLSHAAIVAREYGIPGVVGTKDATKTIRDGQRVRVDGTRGEVTVLG